MKYSGKMYRVKVPKSRDPFINTRLIPAGTDPISGRERFWITSYNANAGCTGVLVDEWGNAKIKKFGLPYNGFYSAVYTEDNTLWLCGFMDKVCSYKPDTEEFHCYNTGGARGLVFNGMPYDPKTGRVFVAVSTPPSTQGMVFDTKTKEVVTFYKDRWFHKYLGNSFPNGDGTYTVLINTPGVGFYRWDPVSCEITLMQSFPPNHGHNVGDSYLLVDNRYYVPEKGWYDPLKNEFTDGIKPDEEAVWHLYDPAEGVIYGAMSQASDSTLVKWDTASGKVTKIYTIKNCYPYGITFTKDFTAVAVNLYGYFYRINLREKCMDVCSRLDTDECGHTDCIMRIDDKTLMGTPFITQRFWKVDLETGEGTDCGRMVSAAGQVNLTWNMDGIVYMASYTSGELAKYDPKLPLFYPENPYVVVHPPKPAMRPVAGATDSESLYYTCDNEYGMPGCMLVKYNTKTNRSEYRKDVLPGQQIRSMFYDPEAKVLVGGSTPEGDCGSYIPEVIESYFSVIDPVTLTVIKKTQAAKDTYHARVLGLLGNGKALVSHKDSTNVWDYVNDTFETLNISEFIQGKITATVPVKKPGLYVVVNNDNLELWNLSEKRKITTLAEEVPSCRVIVDREHIFLHARNDIIVLDYALKGYI
ncbi:MAG: hypothetical protein GX082_07305 [Clostridiaceae bacterium]|nr:hypothetical protein [Clostridiaceae bacterium]